MVTVRGKGEVRDHIAKLPARLERIVRGAARVAANVVADEAKARSISSEVAGAIKVSTKAEPGRVIARVEVKGKGSYLAPWLEYGTAAHFISVDESQREGLSVRKINQRTEDKASLKIGGKFVGATVFHPGAKPHPFLRPALDIKEADAIRAAQQYITARVKKAGLLDNDEGGGA